MPRSTNCQLSDLLLTKLVALGFFSMRLITLVYLITHDKAMEYLLIFKNQDHDLEALPEIIYAVLIIYLVLDLLLFTLSFKNFNCKWIFVVWQMAAMVWVLISILEIFLHETFRDFILGLLSIVVSCWACLVLYRALQEIDEERERSELNYQMSSIKRPELRRTTS